MQLSLLTANLLYTYTDEILSSSLVMITKLGYLIYLSIFPFIQSNVWVIELKLALHKFVEFY